MLTCEICNKKDKSTKKFTEYDANLDKKMLSVCAICYYNRQLVVNIEVFDITDAADYKKELDYIYVELTKELKRRIAIEKAHKKRIDKKKSNKNFSE